MVDAMPLTPNGKVDRNRLGTARIVEDEFSSGRSVEAPTTSVESTIQEIWHELLGLADVGVTENFFDVGGHSLLAVRLYRRLLSDVDSSMSLTDIFRFPTIRSLAQSVGTMKNDAPAALQSAAERGRNRRRRREGSPVESHD